MEAGMADTAQNDTDGVLPRHHACIPQEQDTQTDMQVAGLMTLYRMAQNTMFSHRRTLFLRSTGKERRAQNGTEPGIYGCDKAATDRIFLRTVNNFHHSIVVCMDDAHSFAFLCTVARNEKLPDTTPSWLPCRTYTFSRRLHDNSYCMNLRDTSPDIYAPRTIKVSHTSVHKKAQSCHRLIVTEAAGPFHMGKSSYQTKGTFHSLQSSIRVDRYECHILELFRTLYGT